MSSVGRFIRQVDNSNHFLSAATVVATPGTYVYELVADASNIVGNYAPGYMAVASAALQAAITAANSRASNNVILRDMGKTVRAPINSASGAIGFFRQVQLVDPALGAAGVLGAPATPDAYTNYLTFYVPIAINGVCVVPAAVTVVHPVQGQM
jgi:hypothetical protein